MISVKNQIEKIIRNAKRNGCMTTEAIILYKDCITKKLTSIMNDKEHPLNKNFRYLPSGRRLNVNYSRTSRLNNSFVPSAIRISNAKLKRSK